MRSLMQKAVAWATGKSFQNRFAKVFETGVNREHSLTRPYEQSVWVMRAIKHVATPIAGVGLTLNIIGSDGELEEIQDPLLRAYWKNPFYKLSYDDGIEATIGWLKLEGDCFWLMDDAINMPFPEMASAMSKILISGPDNIRIVYEGDDVLGYEYTNKRGKRIYFDSEQVWHHKFWNPYDFNRGLGEMKASKVAAESDYLAGNFQRNLNRSNGDQGVYVIGKNGIGDDAQREQIKAVIREKQRANQRGESRVAFLSGDDFSIEDPKVRIPDAAFLAGRFADREEVYIAFGVPPSMSSKQSSYSIGSASDRFILIEDTCIPTGKKICEGINYFVQRQLGDNSIVECTLNWKEHSVMQQIRAERGKEIDGLWSKGVPMSVIDDYLDLGLPDYEGKDVGYLPFSVAPVGSVEDPASDPALGEKGVTRRRGDAESPTMRTLDDLKTAFKQREDNGDTVEDFQDSRPDSEKKLWAMHMRDRAASVKRYKSGFKRVLMDARRETLKNIERLNAESRITNDGDSKFKVRSSKFDVKQRAAASDFAFDLELFRTAFFGAMRNSAQTALNDGGLQVLQELGKDDPYTMPPEEVLLFVRQRENLMKNIPDNVHGQIMDALETGIQEGETAAQLAGRVKSTFNAIESSRAVTIAQTETGAAYSYSRDISMRQAGVTHKRWLTSGNANVRPTHRVANQQTVKIDEDFEVGDSFLKHPCDASGDPSETINCHCVSIAVTSPE